MLMAVACNKEDLSENSSFDKVDLSQNIVTFDREIGGVITIETEQDAFPSAITKVTGFDIDPIFSYEITPPDYVITLDDVLRQKDIVTSDCKVVLDGFRKFTVTVEPNCDCEYINIAFTKIIESEKYGKIGGRGAGFLRIELK